MSGKDLHAQEMAGLVGGAEREEGNGVAQREESQESHRLLTQARVTMSGGSGGSVEQLGLLQQHEVFPTSSPLLAGLHDFAMLVVATVPFVVMRMLRWVLARLGVPEHSWRGSTTREALSASNRALLSDAAAALASGVMPGCVSQAAAPPAEGEEPGPCARALALVSAVVSALADTARAFELPWGGRHEAGALVEIGWALRPYAAKDAIDPFDVFKAVRRAGRKALRVLVKDGKRAGAARQPGFKRKVERVYAFQALMRLAHVQPSRLTHTVLQLSDGESLVEVVDTTPMAAGLAYVQSQGPAFSRQAEFMSAFGRLRPSDAKREAEVQAMSVNARTHSLLLRDRSGAARELAWFPRCGAFAVHTKPTAGAKRLGLAVMVKLAAECHYAATLRARRALLRGARFKSLEALEEEIGRRRVYCVAQALPVVCDAVRHMATQPDSISASLRSNALLFVQHSLLSDLNARECSYLSDLVGALDEISARLQVRFSSTPPPPASCVTVGDSATSDPTGLLGDAAPRATITLTLPLPPPEVLERVEGGAAAAASALTSRSLRVRPLVFSTGVNVLQSFGFLRWRFWLPGARPQPGVGVSRGARSYGEILNVAALRGINEYASAAGRAGCPALSALNAHFSPLGSRHPKDAECVALVRNAARELGGCRSVNCKSGKDRTGAELALAMRDEAARQLQLSGGQQAALVDALLGGLSYTVTAQNCAQPAVYSFTEFELATLPPDWAPHWRLCGKAHS
ncbi:hypothetical protein FOA52_010240 [Chlamydomonas sp. UWO 241]|nr:hypothetical protein FOA52_010240 [Chlamydomonas sp. UWO 241]